MLEKIFSLLCKGITLALAAALLASYLGFGKSLHWSLDLFANFHWQYAAVALFSCLWFFVRKNTKLLTFSCLTLLVQLSLIIPFYTHREKNPQAPLCKIISFNVLGSNKKKDDVLAYLSSSGADVIFLSEINNGWAAALQPLQEKYPHTLLHSKNSPFGLACFSKMPIDSMKLLEISDPSSPVIEVRFRSAQGAFTIIGIHPPPPVIASLAARRNLQMKTLQEYVQQSHEPTIIIGDMNATPWGYGLELLRKDHLLDFHSDSTPIQPTWATGTPFCIPIDHALCTNDLFYEKHIAENHGSDHHAIELQVHRRTNH